MARRVIILLLILFISDHSFGQPILDALDHRLWEYNEVDYEAQASQILDSLLLIKQGSLSESELHHLNLLITIAKNKAKISIPNDSLINSCVQYMIKLPRR